NTGVDLFGLDPYPVKASGVDYGIIPTAVSAAEAQGISLTQIVPVYQAFGGGGYSIWTLPTAAQEQQILATWASVVPNPPFDYAYSWGSQAGDSSLSGSADLQQVFAAHNAVAIPLGPTVSSLTDTATGSDLTAGGSVTITLNMSSAVTVTGTPVLSLNDGGVATYSGGSGTSALTFTYTVASSDADVASLAVTGNNLNGGTIAIKDSAGNNANLVGANVALSPAVQIDTTAPTIAISPIAGGSQGFAISGTTTGVENGQLVTVSILNSAGTVLDSYTASDTNGTWSITVTSAQAAALADGSHTVTANVSDKAGNPAVPATQIFTVAIDQDNVPEPPALSIANTSLNVPAGGSVSLGITATPVDSDDTLSIKIAGVPKYET